MTVLKVGKVGDGSCVGFKEVVQTLFCVLCNVEEV